VFIAEKVDYFKKKRVLVTGGAGYVGSNLIKSLLNAGAAVTSLDNYVSGSSGNHHEGCTYVKGSSSDVLELLKPHDYDIIFHFGEYSRVEQSLVRPDLALENSYSSMPSILEFWRLSGAKLIYSGSSTKFADDGAGRQLSPYTFAKAANSELVASYARWYDLSYVLLYFYNVYGGNEIQSGNFSTLIGRYKKYVREGRNLLPVTLPGTQVRNFTHINDITSGVMLASIYGEGDGYGIGSDQGFSVIDVCTMFGCSADFRPANSANRMSGPVMNQKLKDLGWVQQHRLPDEIKFFLQDLPVRR
jgi:UDP-glucose 4-epimerase